MRVAWVHPTWRDLVIERLAGDPVLRRHFLTHCGIHGLVLAVSVGGGASGERTLPLIGADEDWDAIGDRLYALTPGLEPQELVAMLAALRQAVAQLSEPEDEARREVESLAEIALSRARRSWDALGAPIPVGVLDEWFALAQRLPSRPEPPSLAATWADLLPAAVPALTDVPEVARLADWLTLCQILHLFSPGLLTSLGFGSEQEDLVGGFLDAVASDLDAARTEHVLRALDAVGPHLARMRPRAQRLAGWLRADQTQADPWALEDWLAGDPRRESLASAPGEAYDVRRVLADL